MNLKSTFIATIYSVATVFALSNCSAKKEEAHDESMHASAEEAPTQDSASAPQFQVDATFQQQLSAVFTAYVSLKEAFVATDVTKVKEAAAKTAEALANVDMMLLTGVAHNDWMNYTSGLESALKEIQASSDIETQRAAFSKLSDHLYKSIKAYGLGGVTAYYEFCPMAFDNAGGYWLSDASTIRNPYFGDKMLNCGSVEEKLN